MGLQCAGDFCLQQYSPVVQYRMGAVNVVSWWRWYFFPLCKAQIRILLFFPACADNNAWRITGKYGAEFPYMHHIFKAIPSLLSSSSTRSSPGKSTTQYSIRTWRRHSHTHAHRIDLCAPLAVANVRFANDGWSYHVSCSSLFIRLVQRWQRCDTTVEFSAEKRITLECCRYSFWAISLSNLHCKDIVMWTTSHGSFYWSYSISLVEPLCVFVHAQAHIHAFHSYSNCEWYSWIHVYFNVRCHSLSAHGDRVSRSNAQSCNH